MKQNIKLTVDAVVFGYENGKVYLLLINRKYEPFKNQWALPGGYVKDDENLEEAVARELKEESGVEINFLEQLYTFGAVDRDPRGRVVSISYYGLVRPDKFQISAATDAKDVKWFPLNEIPQVSFDHERIIESGIIRLRSKIKYEPIGFELLDAKFPFSDLEKLYSALLGEPVDRRNFRKKIKELNVLDELDDTLSTGPGRPARLFKFNKKRFFQLKKEGVHFEL
ncbi:NUDIX hydrolase [Nonlabens spongiae]|uniref:NUDIX hydrolase n=1 Tax=Nonlabens spongiae TaxID=331648 RepID=UPI000A267133|nr:NUDIX domain-containing protein [Nonlabens spongiae]